LFPGPTDICWDLAGTIVEWDLTAAQAQHFVERYVRLARGSSRTTQALLPDYLIAYSAFRVGYMEMARAGASEQERLRIEQALRSYTKALAHWLSLRGREAKSLSH
jgi:hypothetical protein